jgi:ABC-type uncharacterized transport system substrate-binding protein
MSGIRRREFIAALGGAAAWPLAAGAQQQSVPIIGWLDPRSPDTNLDSQQAFRQGLRETGYVDGENVIVAHRWAENQLDRLPAMAAELVRRRVAVIVTSGGRLAHYAAKSATGDIPIIFHTAEDPVTAGLVTSFARPSGNLTGVTFLTFELGGKRLELLHEMVPRASRIAVLVNPMNVASGRTVRQLELAARSLGLQLQFLNATNSSEIDVAFDALAHEQPDALFIGEDSFYASRRVQLVHLATFNKLPASYSLREFSEVGGLMSYGTDTHATYRQVGAYVGRILKGAKPADLPVVQSSRFELVVNRQTARMLKLEIPAKLLTIADVVIE